MIPIFQLSSSAGSSAGVSAAAVSSVAGSSAGAEPPHAAKLNASDNTNKIDKNFFKDIPPYKNKWFDYLSVC